ncbi:MAG: hypothetical protein N3G22_01715 [Candidatus Micrarchaeota archaeon]|nr:hypothetical protein [Candidatus Micrarchaeota archaeon]
MEIRSFLAGIFFLLGMQILLPLLKVEIQVSLPYAPASYFVVAVLSLILSYYLFRGN